MSSWREIRLEEVGSNQLLDCMWVMIYKFDKQGYLIKAKARLVVRGDQQASHVGVDNYAPTLAGISFWLQEDRNRSAVAQSALWAQRVPLL